MPLHLKVISDSHEILMRVPKPIFSKCFYPNPLFYLPSVNEILRFPHVDNIKDFLNVNFPEKLLYLLGIPGDACSLFCQ